MPSWARVLCAALVALCTAATAHDEPSTGAQFHACYLYYSDVGDLGWTHSHNLGRLAADAILQKEFGDKLHSVYVPFAFFKDNRTALMYEQATRCDLIFVTSAAILLDVDVAQVACDFPNTVFAIDDGTKVMVPHSMPNVVFYDNNNFELWYEAGAVAALRSQSCIGFIGAFDDMPPPVQAVNSLLMGTLKVNASVKVHFVPMGAWVAEEASVTAADVLITRLGCDVVALYLDNQDAHRYVAQQRRGNTQFANIMTIGVHSNVREFVGDSVLVSPFYDWSPFYANFTRHVFLHRHVKGFSDTAHFYGHADGVGKLFESLTVDGHSYRTLVQELSQQSVVHRNGTKVTQSLFCNASHGCRSIEDVLTMRSVDPRVTLHPTFAGKDACPPGTRAVLDAEPYIRVSCLKCPENTFTGVQGQLQCTPCGDGFSAAKGSTSCVLDDRVPPGMLVFVVVPLVVTVLVTAVFGASFARRRSVAGEQRELEKAHCDALRGGTDGGSCTAPLRTVADVLPASPTASPTAPSAPGA